MKAIDSIKQTGWFAPASNWGIVLFFMAVLLPLAGCGGIEKTNLGAATDPQVERLSANDVRIREYQLSPGDEINITVFPQAELNRRLTIPPDGNISYPLLGEIAVKGKNLKELREIILSGLLSYRKADLVSGDEVSITVYRHEELSRRFIIPAEGYAFYPLVGEVELQGKSLKQIRETLGARLAKYIKNPQVEVNLVNTQLPKVVVDPQVSIEVLGFGGQKVFVLGEVRTPGVYLADGSTGVIEAIAAAGSFTLDAEQGSILLIRGGMDTPKPELITLNMEDYLKGDSLIRNINLQGGDIIYVSRSFISNVDRFFEHLYVIVRPLLALESGIYIGQQMEGGVKGTGRSKTTVPVR